MTTSKGRFNIEKYGDTDSESIVIFIHGLPTGNFLWRNVIPHFTESFNVWAVELLGCGQSDNDPHLQYDISAQAEGIAEIIRTAGKPVFLITHDIGTGVSQRLLILYPELIHKAVLINPIGYDYWPVNVVKLWRAPIISYILNAIVNKFFMKKVISDGMYHKEKFTDDILKLYTDNFRTQEQRRGVRMLMQGLHPKYLMEISEKLKNIEQEVLIIHSENDIYLTPDISKRLAADIPNATLMNIPEAGHFIQEDIPDKLAKILIEFLVK